MGHNNIKPKIFTVMCLHSFEKDLYSDHQKTNVKSYTYCLCLYLLRVP
jgi:hypothetical protein